MRRGTGRPHIEPRAAAPLHRIRTAGGGLIPHWTVLRNAALVPRLRKLASPDDLASTALQLVGLPPEEFGPAGRGSSRVVSDSEWLGTCVGGGTGDHSARRTLPSSRRHHPCRACRRVHALLRDIGVTALLVTHDIRTALEIADRVAVLRGGKFEQIAPAAELRGSPASPYVRQLLHRAGEGPPA